MLIGSRTSQPRGTVFSASFRCPQIIRSPLRFGSRRSSHKRLKRLLVMHGSGNVRRPVSVLETMPRKSTPPLSRRSFLAAAAGFAAAPAIAATAPATGSLDVVIVGAGAAGIAAARRIAAAGRRYLLIEATDHLGGRCFTDTKSFGVPYDRGARWIYLPDQNPVTRFAPRRGLDVYPASQSRKVRIGRRYAREGELEDFLTAQV